MQPQPKTIHIQYYAALREQRKCREETVNTSAVTPLELYKELKTQHKFTLAENVLRVAINDEFKDWTTPLQSGDRIVFIPPVAGG